MNKTITSLYILGAMLSPFAMAYDYDEQECLPLPNYVEGYSDALKSYDMELFHEQVGSLDEDTSEKVYQYHHDFALDRIELLQNHQDEMSTHEIKVQLW